MSVRSTGTAMHFRNRAKSRARRPTAEATIRSMSTTVEYRECDSCNNTVTRGRERNFLTSLRIINRAAHTILSDKAENACDRERRDSEERRNREKRKSHVHCDGLIGDTKRERERGEKHNDEEKPVTRRHSDQLDLQNRRRGKRFHLQGRSPSLSPVDREFN